MEGTGEYARGRGDEGAVDEREGTFAGEGERGADRGGGGRVAEADRGEESTLLVLSWGVDEIYGALTRPVLLC